MAKSGKDGSSPTCVPMDQIALACSVGPYTRSQDTALRYCARCGKCLTDPETGTSFIGVTFDLTVGGEGDFSEGFFRKQLGAYLPSGQNHIEYDICWECWMKSFGIKPKIVE